MHGFFKSENNPHPGSVKYYSPTDLSRICRQNTASVYGRESENHFRNRAMDTSEQEKYHRRHHHEKPVLNDQHNENKKRKKSDKKRGYFEDIPTFEQLYFTNNYRKDKRKEKKSKHRKDKEFSELNYHDLQCLINDYNQEQNVEVNFTNPDYNNVKKKQRSQSIDQIPTRDTTTHKRPERPKSAERQEELRVRHAHNRHLLPMQPQILGPMDDKTQYEFLVTNQEFNFNDSTKRNRMESKKKHVSHDDYDFVTLDQINEQTMNLEEERYERDKYAKWHRRRSREKHAHHKYLYDEYKQHTHNQMIVSDNTDRMNVHNNDNNQKIIPSPQQRNDIGDEIGMNKERREKHRKKNDNDFNVMKKYIKNLVREQDRDNGRNRVQFTKPETDENNTCKKQTDHCDDNFQLFNNFNSIQDKDYSHQLKKKLKKNKKDFGGLEEDTEFVKHRKKHDHHKYKTGKGKKKHSSEKVKLENSERKDANKERYMEGILQENISDMSNYDGTFLKIKHKSDTSLESTRRNNKDIICLFENKDSPEQSMKCDTVKLAKKLGGISIDKKDNCVSMQKNKVSSPYDKNQTVLPTEPTKQMALNIQRRNELFEKAIKRDFPSRPRPRLSRSRHRSSKTLTKLDDCKVNKENRGDEKPTKDVYCYDVGTSTILDNNFGEVLELLKGETVMKQQSSDKKRSVFHVKKKVSREELIETSRRANNSTENTLGIVVKGIEPPRKLETKKVSSRFKLVSEKTKPKRLECKILSVVAIAPEKFDNEEETYEHNAGETMSTPNIQHRDVSSEIRSPSPDRRLERLLKYYKVESESLKGEISVKDSKTTNNCKSFKDLIASKLTDCLKKLQQDDESMLKFQTDDSRDGTIVKLVLPIDMGDIIPEPSIDDLQLQIPRESYSDLNINYSDANEDIESFFQITNSSIVDAMKMSFKKCISDWKNTYLEPYKPALTNFSKTLMDVREIEEHSLRELDDNYIQPTKTSFLEEQLVEEGPAKPTISDDLENLEVDQPERMNQQAFSLNANNNYQTCNTNSFGEENLRTSERTEKSNVMAAPIGNSYFTEHQNNDRNPPNSNHSQLRKDISKDILSPQVFASKVDTNPTGYHCRINGLESCNQIRNINNQMQVEKNDSKEISQENNSTTDQQHFIIADVNMKRCFIENAPISLNSTLKKREFKADIFQNINSTQSTEPYNRRKSDTKISSQLEKLEDIVGKDQKITYPRDEGVENNFVKSKELKKKYSGADHLTSWKARNSTDKNKHEDDSESPDTLDKKYEYFEIPLPQSKSSDKMQMRKKEPLCEKKLENEVIRSRLRPSSQKDNVPRSEESNLNRPDHNRMHANKNSFIPRRVKNNKLSVESSSQPNTSHIFNQPNKNEENEPRKKDTNLNNKSDFNTSESTLNQQDVFVNKNAEGIMDESLQKCLDWNYKISKTVVSETTEYVETEKSNVATTVVTRKTNMPMVKNGSSRISPDRSSSRGRDNTTSMFLTKTYKMAPGQSSYERRKLYDTRIRKNSKKRSLSESGEPTKNLPHVYEVRYFNLCDQQNPLMSTGPHEVRSDQTLCFSSVYCDHPRSISSLSSVPSCFLREGDSIEQNVKQETKMDILKNNNLSFKSERIPDLIRSNLLYGNHSDASESSHIHESTRNQTETKKQGKQGQSEKNRKNKVRNKIKLKCSRKKSWDIGKKAKTVSKVTNIASNSDKKCMQLCSQSKRKNTENVTKLSIDKVNDNELFVYFENEKLSIVGSDYTGLLEQKSNVSIYSDVVLLNDHDSLDNSVSSKSTVINCGVLHSTSTLKNFDQEESTEPHSGKDSGYLTNKAETNASETTCNSVNPDSENLTIRKGEKSNSSKKKSNIPRYKYTKTESEKSKWNDKDLIRLKNQLLFPDIYDDFELLESAKNTQLITHYVESANDKLQKAIDTISQKETDNMTFRSRSRSVMSLPSVRMIPEEYTSSSVNGDISSEYSFRSNRGGFYNYQKFVAQKNGKYSSLVSSRSNVGNASGDADLPTNEEDFSESESDSEKPSVKSVKNIASNKRSVIELFKIRPFSKKMSSSSLISNQEIFFEKDNEETLKNNVSDEEFLNNFHHIMSIECQKFAKKVKEQTESNENMDIEEEFEELPLDFLLKNRSLAQPNSVDCLDSEFQLASNEVDGNLSQNNLIVEHITDDNSASSFKSTTCVQEKTSTKMNDASSKAQCTENISSFILDFYPDERISILDMFQNMQISSMSSDSLNNQSKTNDIDSISSKSMRDSSKTSEKMFFDNLLAFYDKEAEFIRKLVRDDEFFISLIESIRNDEDSTNILYQKDTTKKNRREKKRGIFSRFFRWKEKKSDEKLYETTSMGKSLEFAKSFSGGSTSITRDSCMSFFKEFEDYDKEFTEQTQMNTSTSKYYQQLAHRAKSHLEPMVRASMCNRQINDKIKLAGFLKLLEMVERGDFNFLNHGDSRPLEDKLKDHVAQMFAKVYRIANRETKQQDKILDNAKIVLLKTLVTKYHMGIDDHINILSIYIGRDLIRNKTQLEDAILYLMGLESQEVNLEQFEKNCAIQNHGDDYVNETK